MIPSIRTIETQLRVSRDTARIVRKLMDRTADPLEVSPKTEAWRRSCYSEPVWYELVLHAIDCVLETCGVESLTLPSEGYRCPKRYRGEYSYANNGDSYAATVVRDHARSRWLICGWTDLAEKESEARS